MDTKTIDGCGCCGNCPTDCSACGDSMTLDIDGPSGDGCCDATGLVTLWRYQCIWSGSQFFLGNCVSVSAVIACDPKDGMWRITIDLSSCCSDYSVNSIYQSAGRAGACPPKGVWNLAETGTGCGGQIQVHLT